MWISGLADEGYLQIGSFDLYGVGGVAGAIWACEGDGQYEVAERQCIARDGRWQYLGDSRDYSRQRLSVRAADSESSCRQRKSEEKEGERTDLAGFERNRSRSLVLIE